MTPGAYSVRPQLIAVVGPTASGKTELALALAERLKTEIVSADSMQFYRGMEIGTAAPTPEERERVRHHFVGFLEPGAPYSAGQYQRDARAVVAELNAQGKIAVAAGGAGLYVRALIDGLFEGPGKNPEIRERLHRQIEDEGLETMYQTLVDVDPKYADVIDSNDARRIVRALEVFYATGRPISDHYDDQAAESAPLDALQVAVDYPREVLYERIEARVDRMMERGFLGEVQHLLDEGHGPALDRLKCLGYVELTAHLRGEYDLDTATALIKQNSRRYAKRQLTWFRGDDRVQWIEGDCSLAEKRDQILALVNAAAAKA